MLCSFLCCIEQFLTWLLSSTYLKHSLSSELQSLELIVLRVEVWLMDYETGDTNDAPLEINADLRE